MLFGGKVLVAERAGHGSGPWDKLEIRTGFFGVCVVGGGTYEMIMKLEIRTGFFGVCVVGEGS